MQKSMKTPLKRITTIILASALVAALSAGCGTVRGFGRDVESVGDGIQKSTR